MGALRRRRSGVSIQPLTTVSPVLATEECPPRTIDLDNRPLFLERHKEGVRSRIDLGARLGHVLTA
jgi:hypothetical protein